MGKVLKYSSYISIFEGGAAVKSSRRILEREAAGTIESIKKMLLPLLGNGEIDKDYLIIGSIGKKKSPDDTSGDIDLGVDQSFIARKLGADPNNVLDFLEPLCHQRNCPIGYYPIE